MSRTGSDDTRREAGRAAVDSLAEEAARLVSELRESVSMAQLAAEHPSSVCRACPVCQVLAVIQQMSPEAVDHLTMAMSELGRALRALVNPPGPDDAATGSRSGPTPDTAAPASGSPGPGPQASGVSLPVAQRIDIA